MSSRIPLDARLSRTACASASFFFHARAAVETVKGRIGSSETSSASSSEKSSSRIW